MVIIKSQRAQALLESPRFFIRSLEGQLKRYPRDDWKLWVGVEKEGENVKKLSFHGEVEPWERVLLESWASIMIGRPFSRIDQFALRECEAYLRDRNSEPALENLGPESEENFKRLFAWIKSQEDNERGEPYIFHSQKGPFRNLKLTDKVRELKGFLGSSEVISLYHDLPRPTLLDVEDLTVYIEVPYQTERDKALLEELHMMGVEVFQEENLNFIPEA